MISNLVFRFYLGIPSIYTWLNINLIGGGGLSSLGQGHYLHFRPNYRRSKFLFILSILLLLLVKIQNFDMAKAWKCFILVFTYDYSLYKYIWKSCGWRQVSLGGQEYMFVIVFLRRSAHVNSDGPNVWSKLFQNFRGQHLSKICVIVRFMLVNSCVKRFWR